MSFALSSYRLVLMKNQCTFINLQGNFLLHPTSSTTILVTCVFLIPILFFPQNTTVIYLIAYPNKDARPINIWSPIKEWMYITSFVVTKFTFSNLVGLHCDIQLSTLRQSSVTQPIWKLNTALVVISGKMRKGGIVK